MALFRFLNDTRNMKTDRYTETLEARLWDSERRDSPYSTVADPNADDYCEGCDSTVDYSTDHVHGTCNCEGI